MAPSWLVTGSAGFLGQNSGLFLEGRAQRVGLTRTRQSSHVFDDYITIDLRDHVALAKAITDVRPRVILHAAAVSGHIACAENPEDAWEVNVETTRIIAELASQMQAKLIFVSTDAVFSGDSGNYSESDSVNPFSYYGETKVAAEEYVLALAPESLIVRTNFFGWSRQTDTSVLEFFVNSLRRGIEVYGYQDSVVTSIYVGSLVESIWKLANSPTRGIVHIASRDALSKCDFGLAVAKEFDLDPSLITTQDDSERNSSSARGRNISLNTDLVSTLLGELMPSQGDGIRLARQKEDMVRAAFINNS